MKLKKATILAWMIFAFSQTIFAQPAERRISRKEYIELWKDEAIAQMHQYGIPASITLAQGMLESGDGNSPLAKYAHNHFGIKCHDWKGETYYQDDDIKHECFRKYENAEESFKDHSEFLRNKSRYAFLFTYSSNDYESWAYGLKKAGYATAPHYATALIQIIEEHELYKYDGNEVFAKKEINTKKDAVATVASVKHTIAVHDNNIRYIIAKEGDTPFKISKEFEMGLWQIYKYNDLSKKDEIKKGDIIYLQPKRNKAKLDFHVVEKGETMKIISQKYGIKLKKLYKKNNMSYGSEPVAGTVLSLRGKAEPGDVKYIEKEKVLAKN